ncbi:hypothetical protein EWM64_g3284 [Hericium alpestre]|uniref:Essential protein Yae1 N-terminal domain-containing protein n=1 Tax=Hericium alpestre TaxID=135208 RepID=A0A4Z0A4X2_9AGAM|nr:hypothetical protein EWM64_g3284 [Hericium alpestre]
MEARVEVHQREQAWKDSYEQGLWDGYREGLEIARTEVSTPSSVDASIQANVSIPPHSPPADTVPTSAHVDTGVQFDAPPLSSPSCAGSPPPIPVDIVPTAPCIHIGVQADAPVSSPLLNTPFTTPCVNVHVQTHDPIPMRVTSYIGTGIQAEDSPPTAIPLSPPDDSHSPHSRVQTSMQTDMPCSSVPARARIVQEIEPGLLTEILAKAIARGEAAGLQKGKHIGFQEGFEVGKKSELKGGHEQVLAEVSSVSRAIAVVQTDDVDWPARVDRTSQTLLAACPLDLAMVTNVSNNSSLRVLSTHDTNSATASTPKVIHFHVSTTISNVSTSHNNLSLSHNDIHMTFLSHLAIFPFFDLASHGCLIP